MERKQRDFDGFPDSDDVCPPYMVNFDVWRNIGFNDDIDDIYVNIF